MAWASASPSLQWACTRLIEMLKSIALTSNWLPPLYFNDELLSHREGRFDVKKACHQPHTRGHALICGGMEELNSELTELSIVLLMDFMQTLCNIRVGVTVTWRDSLQKCCFTREVLPS